MRDLDETERVDRLSRYLLNADLPRGYLILARLIASGWFSLIVTTNVDNFLEEALSRVGVRTSDIRKLVFGDMALASILAALEEPFPHIKILKLCGDLMAGKFLIDSDEVVEFKEGLERVLGNLFRHDTIIVGHGVGDPDLTRYFKRKGNSIWLVNPESKLHEDLLPFLRARRSEENIIPEIFGRFDIFFEEIERILSTKFPGPYEGLESTSYSGRAAKLQKLQEEMERIHQEFEAIKDADPNFELQDHLRMLEQLSQQIDALSNAGEGTILGGFKIGERLGRGGVGSVYRAVHIWSKLQAAVKIMAREYSQDPTWRLRFFRGAKIMATLNHPNIVRILDVGGIVGPWCYYAMELINGPNLDTLLATDSLEIEQRWSIAQGILEALAYGHQGHGGTSIVHRDLKPSNILISANGIPKVTDFDMAFLEDPTALTRSSTAPFGMSFYMAPELEFDPTLNDLRDPRVDVFALGRILLRLFTDVQATERLAVQYFNNPDLLRLALSRYASGSTVNALCSLIERAMAFEREKRFKNAGEMLQVFNRVREISYTQPADLIKNLKLEFAEIPLGSFMMGSPADEPGREVTETLHQVEITSDFLLSTTPITRRIWAAIWGEKPPTGDEENIPMEKVSWYDAVGFCNALSLYYGFTPCYRIDEDGVIWDREADGFRLPTEAEWEYACRAGTKTTYYLGDTESDLSRSAWYQGNCSEGPVPVAQKQPNAWELWDMHGNVWEWCWDWFAPYSGTEETDPLGPEIGSTRVLRGGSYRRSPHHCRSATRYESSPENHGRSIGFRVARTIKH